MDVASLKKARRVSIRQGRTSIILFFKHLVLHAFRPERDAERGVTGLSDLSNLALSASCAAIARSIPTKDLDDETIEAILNAEPGEQSREAGRRLADPGAG